MANHLQISITRRAKGDAEKVGLKLLTCSCLSRSAAPRRERISCGLRNMLPAITLHMRHDQYMHARELSRDAGNMIGA